MSTKNILVVNNIRNCFVTFFVYFLLCCYQNVALAQCNSGGCDFKSELQKETSWRVHTAKIVFRGNQNPTFALDIENKNGAEEEFVIEGEINRGCTLNVQKNDFKCLWWHPLCWVEQTTDVMLMTVTNFASLVEDGKCCYDYKEETTSLLLRLLIYKAKQKNAFLKDFCKR